jgi:hypothetical protein
VDGGQLVIIALDHLKANGSNVLKEQVAIDEIRIGQLRSHQCYYSYCNLCSTSYEVPS